MFGESEFVEAVEPYRDVMALLAARLAPEAPPGKVVRDACALAVRHRSEFDPQRADLRSWLLAITADCAVAARPRRGRAAAPVAELPGPAASIKRSTPEQELDSLPDRQRFAVECVHFVGLSVGETVELMRVSERAVRSALADGQRRMSSLLGAGAGASSGDGPAGDDVGDQLSAAGSVWRAAFLDRLREDLREPGAPPGFSTEDSADEHSPVEVDEVAGPPVDDAGSPQTESRQRWRIRKRWLLIAIGVVVLVAGGSVAVLTAKRSAGIAADDQGARAYQQCGQIPPALAGVTVRRLDAPTDGSFRVRVVADRTMTVVSATVTGVDANGRIATYVRPDPAAEMFVSIVTMEEAGHPMVLTASTATDRCDGSSSGTRGLTNHLLLTAVGGGLDVMDAGPVDQLAVGDR